MTAANGGISSCSAPRNFVRNNPSVAKSSLRLVVGEGVRTSRTGDRSGRDFNDFSKRGPEVSDFASAGREDSTEGAEICVEAFDDSVDGCVA